MKRTLLFFLTAGALFSANCTSLDPAFIGGTLLTSPLLCYGASFSYRTALPSGLYRVHLTLTEPSPLVAKQRVFSVTINGQISPGIDIAAESGANGTITRDYVALSAVGYIQLDFVGQVGNAVVSAVTIGPYTPPPPPPPPPAKILTNLLWTEDLGLTLAVRKPQSGGIVKLRSVPGAPDQRLTVWVIRDTPNIRTINAQTTTLVEISALGGWAQGGVGSTCTPDALIDLVGGRFHIIATPATERCGD